MSLHEEVKPNGQWKSFIEINSCDDEKSRIRFNKVDNIDITLEQWSSFASLESPIIPIYDWTSDNENELKKHYLLDNLFQLDEILPPSSTNASICNRDLKYLQRWTRKMVKEDCTFLDINVHPLSEPMVCENPINAPSFDFIDCILGGYSNLYHIPTNILEIRLQHMNMDAIYQLKQA